MPDPIPIGIAGWLRILVKGGALIVLLAGGLTLMLALRLLERPIWGLDRPITPYITQGVCRAALWLMGLRRTTRGRPMRRPGGLVANHSSWVDIFAINARCRVYFVSKSEVAGWPGIGWLARATATVFVERNPKDAAAQVQVLTERLAAGHRLVVFPEGTSTDGRRVLDFKPTLFAAFLSPGLTEDIWIQPVSLIYEAPAGADPRVYGWWGGMAFGPHLAGVLALRSHGRVTVTFHDPVRVADVTDRKALASQTGATVRQALEQAGIVACD